MMNGTTIFVHRDETLLKRVEAVICRMSPQIHIVRAMSGSEVLMMQAFLRADAVVLDAGMIDVSVEHVIYELKRDIVNPHVMIYERNGQMQRKWIGLGADGVIGAQSDAIQVGEEIGRMIKRREENGERANLLAERLIQRLFMECGIPCSLKGYRFLKTAVVLINGCSQEEIGIMNRLYEKIGQRHGCSAACVERNIRHVIDLCWSRSDYVDCPRPSNARFIAQILEDTNNGGKTVLKPKISVYCSEKRLFC